MKNDYFFINKFIHSVQALAHKKSFNSILKLLINFNCEKWVVYSEILYQKG